MRSSLLRRSLLPYRSRSLPWQAGHYLARNVSTFRERKLILSTRQTTQVLTNPLLKAKPNWPLNILKSAHDAGEVAVPSESSIVFLDEIWKLAIGAKLNRRSLESVLEDHHLKTQDITSIARLLITQRSQHHLASLGIDMLSLSADLGDEAAAFILVDLTIDSKSSTNIGSSRYQKALSHVKRLANEDLNLQALVLLGKVYEQAQQYQDALNLYEKAMEAHERNEVYEDDRTPLAEAFRNAGRLSLIGPGNEDLAFHYFDIAAREYEDAYSFYSMALIRGDDHPDYFALLSQAAISGVLEATYELGVWYSKQGDASGARQNARHIYSMASHWLELAKDLPKMEPRAILHIARIERLGILGNGIKPFPESVQEAIQGSNVEEELKLKWTEQWSNPHFSLTAADLELNMEEIKD